MKQKIFTLSLTIFFILSLSSCGNKGDLYVPDKKKDSGEKVE
jgi:predicted small lipoprotein YifL